MTPYEWEIRRVAYAMEKQLKELIEESEARGYEVYSIQINDRNEYVLIMRKLKT